MFVRVIICRALIAPTASSAKVSEGTEACRKPVAVAVPETATVRGLLVAFEVTTRFAVRLPDAVGVKTRLRVQVPAAGMASEQSSVSEKSVAGEKAIEEIVVAALPMLRRTT